MITGANSSITGGGFDSIMDPDPSHSNSGSFIIDSGSRSGSMKSGIVTPLASPFEPVEVSDCDALEEGDDEEGHAAGKVVEQREDVVARTVRERQRQHEAHAADHAWKNKRAT